MGVAGGKGGGGNGASRLGSPPNLSRRPAAYRIGVGVWGRSLQNTAGAARGRARGQPGPPWRVASGGGGAWCSSLWTVGAARANPASRASGEAETRRARGANLPVLLTHSRRVGAACLRGALWRAFPASRPRCKRRGWVRAWVGAASGLRVNLGQKCGHFWCQHFWAQNGYFPKRSKTRFQQSGH